MRYFYTVFILLIIVSCNNSHSRRNSEIETANVQILNVNLLNPSRLTQLGKFLLFEDTNDTFLLHLLEINTLKEKFRGYKIGRGPNEILAPFSIFKNNENEFWIHDIVLSKFNRFIIDNGCIYIKNKISLKDVRVMYPTFLNDTIIIAQNILEKAKGWIIALDTSGNYIKSIVDFPVYKTSFPDNIYTESLQGIIKIKPNKDKFIVGCRFTDRLSFYSKEGNLIKTFRTNDPFDPVMAVGSTGNVAMMAHTKETRYAFVSLEVSDNYVYALFSGSSLEDGTPNLAERLFVFDWSGELLKEIRIPYPTESICWSNSDNSLYMFLIKDKQRELAKIDFKNGK
jgi:hypothetical protein